MEEKIELGKYTATWRRRDIYNGGCIYMLDQYLDKPYQMSENRRGCQNYRNSDLRHHLLSDFEKDENFDRYRPFLLPVDPNKTGEDLISIPTISQFFGGLLEEGPDCWARNALINKIVANFDTNKLDRDTVRWEYWHMRQEERCTFSREIFAGWLQDASYSYPEKYACFTIDGTLDTSICTEFLGVRPIIKLKEM